MHTLAILLTGYSIFSALILALTHFRSAHYPERTQSQIMGTALMFALGGLQLMHFAYLQFDNACLDQPLYRMLLFAIAPAFYLYSKPLLHTQTRFYYWQLLHGTPILVAPFFTPAFAILLAFAVGAMYLLWLARSVYALRAQRSRFRLELFILGTVFFIALCVLILGVTVSQFDEKLFFSLYASAIGCAFILVSLTINLTPHLAADVAEVASEIYGNTTLAQVDCDAMIARLTGIMEQQHLFTNPELNLSGLAQLLNISNHQLSELINTRLGKGFSRYVREYRIAAAKTMLLNEPSASVLSIGLSVGFTSQSNFYDAFREITGMTPGKFRKITPLPVPK